MEAKNKIKFSEIRKVSHEINTELESKKLFEIIMETACSMIHCEGSSLLLLDQEKNELYFNVAISDKSEAIKKIHVPIGKGIAGQVAQTGVAVVSNDAQNDTRLFKKVDLLTNYKTRNLLCVPMKVKDKLVGVLEVVNSLNENGFTKYDVSVLGYIADQAAIALNNREMLNNLKKLNKDLENRVKEITILFEISQNTNYTYDIQQLYNLALEIIVSKMEVERSSLFIYDESNNRLKLVSWKGIDELGKDFELEIDEGIVGEVFKQGEPLLVANIDHDANFNHLKKDYYKTNSFLSVPLRNEGNTVGVLSVADKQNKEAFSHNDLYILSSIASHIASVVNTIELKKKLLDQEKFKKELEAAETIQKNILAIDIDTNNRLDVSAGTYSAENVGGDFYDFLAIDDTKFGFLIGDVSGKGIPAAIFMALVRNIIHAEAKRISLPAQVFKEANKIIFDESKSGMFTTASYFVVDTHNRILTFSNAGHNSQILFKNKERNLEFLQARGIPLGIEADSSFEEKVIFYQNGDILVLYTDGIIDALNDEQEEFGEENFFRLIKDNAHLNAEELHRFLKEAVLHFVADTPLFDDFSLMIIKL